MTTISWTPTKADLDGATARTADVMADPAATPADRYRAAAAEESIHQGFLLQPGADAELQAEAEAELEAVT